IRPEMINTISHLIRMASWAILVSSFGVLVWGIDPDAIPTPKPGPPSIEEYATIESYCNGFPVYSFSNIDYVYGVGPDLYPGAIMQEGNTHPVKKVPPKKSWEIKHNYMGSEHSSTRKSAWYDSEP